MSILDKQLTDYPSVVTTLKGNIRVIDRQIMTPTPQPGAQPGSFEPANPAYRYTAEENPQIEPGQLYVKSRSRGSNPNVCDTGLVFKMIAKRNDTDVKHQEGNLDDWDAIIVYDQHRLPESSTKQVPRRVTISNYMLKKLDPVLLGQMYNDIIVLCDEYKKANGL